LYEAKANVPVERFECCAQGPQDKKKKYLFQLTGVGSHKRGEDIRKALAERKEKLTTAQLKALIDSTKVKPATVLDPSAASA
jgi:hypothetical protein